MKKEILKVPKGVRFISDWEEFGLRDFPHIIDKKIPGCGFTEYCLTNSMDLILACPRKILLENKRDQHKEDVYLVQSLLGTAELGVDKDLNDKKRKQRPKKMDSVCDDIFQMKEALRKTAPEEYARLRSEIDDYIVLRRSIGKPCKILVTYDSYRKVKNILQDLGSFDQFYTVVDEMQSVFVDARFKSDTEMEFVEELKTVQKVCYVSATPMLDKYLDQLEEFKDLPYYEIDWYSEDPARVAKPNLIVSPSKSVVRDAKKIIDQYKSGEFEVYLKELPTGEFVEVKSREAVFYMNSLNNILQVIKSQDLKPEEVNILCANTPDNLSRLEKSLGKGFSIGQVPLKGQPRKMFTFCTRTVYLGADFYSDNARSFVFSDANIECMAVDITLDLPQILGRQRLAENPWKNSANVYIKCIKEDNKIDLVEFKKIIDSKISDTKSLLKVYENCDSTERHTLAIRYLRLAHDYNYEYDYVSVNCHSRSDLVPAFNNLALVAEQRAYDIQQLDYADRFTVFNQLNDVFGAETVNNVQIQVDEFFSVFNQFTKNFDRMKHVCTVLPGLSDLARDRILQQLTGNPKTIKYSNYYRFFGPERCRSLGYDLDLIKKEYQKVTFPKDKVAEAIYAEFKEGDKFTPSYFKSKIGEVYESIGYKATPKAVDIGNWFDYKVGKLKDSTGKWIKSFELTKRKGK